MTESVRRRVACRVMGPVVGIVAGLMVLGCTVDGEATAGSPDLSSRSLTAADFPDGAASRVPATAVADALADLTGHRMHGDVVPPDCMPYAVSAEGAAVMVGPDPRTSTATFTSAVVRAGRGLSDVASQARRCPRYLAGSAPTAVSTVTTRVVPAPTQRGITTTGLQRDIATGGVEAAGSSSTTTGTTTLMAQRNGVRVITEYRHQGGGAPSATTRKQLDALFDKAVDRAFR
ncbi:hypothetical protein AAFP35_09785 [Gordonia sp. CPCC 206044]|uniref:hypothetical protein n=1 Tax=Gordonia sp. CPCC 206044 TaxID=3140793 RepID=UPI003AF340B9